MRTLSPIEEQVMKEAQANMAIEGFDISDERMRAIMAEVLQEREAEQAASLRQAPTRRKELLVAKPP